MSLAEENHELRADCPNCGAQKTTFDVLQSNFAPHDDYKSILFCRCRGCYASVNFVVSYNRKDVLRNLPPNGRVLNIFVSDVTLQRPIFTGTTPCPDHCPISIKEAFDEANVCLSVSAFNGAGAMFRKTIDLATRTLIAEDEIHKIGDKDFISWKTYKDLRLRIDWLLERSMLDSRIIPLIDCIREDGNDAVHSSENLDKNTCLDLLDFTLSVLELVFTEPGRIAESIRRRNERRGK